MIGEYCLTGNGIRALMDVQFVPDILIMMEYAIMNDAMNALIRRLEDTLKRQEAAVSATRSQLEAARQLVTPAAPAGGRR